MLALLRRGQLSKWFSGIGQEAVSVGLAAALRQRRLDPARPPQPGRVHRSGLRPRRAVPPAPGPRGRLTGGRDRTFHFGDLDHHVVGMISHLGAMAPVADGLALAALLRGEDRVAAVLIGDGATSEGDVHEAMNLAAVWKLPVLFVIENNQWGLSTPVTDQYACVDLVDRAAGYGMPGELVDGNDVLAVRDAVPAGGGPGTGGQGSDAARVQDVPHAGPRGGVRATTTCPRRRSPPGWRAIRSSASRPGSTSAACCLRPSAPCSARSSGSRSRTWCPTALAAPAPATTEDDELGRVYAARGAAPSCRHGARPRFTRCRRRHGHALRRRREGRPAGGAGRRRPGGAARAGHRRLRRRVQGHRGPGRASSAPNGCATRRSSSQVPSAPRSDWRSTGSVRWSRCSSATS